MSPDATAENVDGRQKVQLSIVAYFGITFSVGGYNESPSGLSEAKQRCTGVEPGLGCRSRGFSYSMSWR